MAQLIIDYNCVRKNRPKMSAKKSVRSLNVVRAGGRRKPLPFPLLPHCTRTWTRCSTNWIRTTWTLRETFYKASWHVRWIDEYLLYNTIFARNNARFIQNDQLVIFCVHYWWCGLQIIWSVEKRKTALSIIIDRVNGNEWQGINSTIICWTIHLLHTIWFECLITPIFVYSK